jgi:gluconolactonase
MLALTYDHEGQLFGAGWSSRAILRLRNDGRIEVIASHYKGRRINCPDDLVVKSDGAIYWTDSTEALVNPFFPPSDIRKYLDFNGVFRLSADGNDITPVITDVEAPNGIAFSADEQSLYVSDRDRRHVRTFSVQTDGTLDDVGVFYSDDSRETGAFGGMKVDVAGNLYCCTSNGLHVLAPNGDLLGHVRLDAATNIAWGEADWRTLFVTGGPHLFRIRTGIPGVPVGRRG